MIDCREITEADNAAVAALVRDNLKARGLDIPGMVYFDEITVYPKNEKDNLSKDERNEIKKLIEALKKSLGGD